MKIKLVQDSIIFISALKKEELEKAKRFCPNACTLNVKDEETKKVTPVCSIAYADEGSISKNGIVFDSTTEQGYMCHTAVASQGWDEHVPMEAKAKLVSEKFANLILNANRLEEQITSALADNDAKINEALNSVETVEI